MVLQSPLILCTAAHLFLHCLAAHWLAQQPQYHGSLHPIHLSLSRCLSLCVRLCLCKWGVARLIQNTDRKWQTGSRNRSVTAAQRQIFWWCSSQLEDGITLTARAADALFTCHSVIMSWIINVFFGSHLEFAQQNSPPPFSPHDQINVWWTMFWKQRCIVLHSGVVGDQFVDPAWRSSVHERPVSIGGQGSQREKPAMKAATKEHILSDCIKLKKAQLAQLKQRRCKRHKPNQSS